MDMMSERDAGAVEVGTSAADILLIQGAKKKGMGALWHLKETKKGY